MIAWDAVFQLCLGSSVLDLKAIRSDQSLSRVRLLATP